jgi:hypothetical protein
MASGDVLHRWQAQDGAPPSTAFAALVRRNNHFLAAFDLTTDESLDFADVLDRRYTGGGITCVLAWAADTVTSGTCRWEGLFERHQDDTDDLDADSFAASQSAGTVTASAAGELKYTTITFTNAQIDGILVGEDFRFRVRRDADGTTGTDDMASDAHLKSVELRET